MSSMFSSYVWIRSAIFDYKHTSKQQQFTSPLKLIHSYCGWASMKFVNRLIIYYDFASSSFQANATLCIPQWPHGPQSISASMLQPLNESPLLELTEQMESI